MKAKKLLSLVLAVVMLLSVVPMGAVAATTISYSPNPKVEYSYSSGVTTGTIRYISQIKGSTYFNSNYWPANSFGGYSSPGSECGTASISMALSYIGVNKTPKTILEAHNGYTYFTGWGPSTSNPSVATGMSNYINGNGKYSPPIVHFTTGYASGTHYVLLIGKVSSNAYLVLDPASNSTWTLSTSDAKYKSIDQVFQYYNANASITPDVQQPTKIIYPTNGGIYKIASGVGNNMYLDFACSSNNVQIYENCDGHSNPDFVKSQYYKLTHIGDGWYTIVNTGNGKAADVEGANSASGTNVIQYEHHKGGSQQFRFYDAGNGYCYIKSKLGTYLDVANGDNVSNTNVWAYSFNGSNAQKWKLQSHSHSYSSKVTTAATCTKTGVKTFTCYCGVSYTETIAKKAHSYTSTVTTQPTCTKEGVRTYKCSCGASYTEKIAKKAHNSNTVIPAVAATCTKTGLTEGKKCSVCGTVTTAQQTVAKKAHSYTSSVTTQPTCTKEGIRTYKCSTCTASYTETIAKKAHTVVTVNVVAPTCTKTGLTEGKRCSVCGTVTVAQQTIPAIGHTDSNGDYKCDYGCGYEYEKPAPDTPSNPSENCGCNCHKGGIAGFFFKIILFFQKIFKTNKICACGVAHY